jgi:hypothetical protein
MPLRTRKSSSALSRVRASTPVPASDTAPPVPPIPANLPQKPHITGALKYLSNDAQRDRALQVAEEWRMKFASNEWSNVLVRIEKAKRGAFPPEVNRSSEVSTVTEAGEKAKKAPRNRSETDESRRRTECWGRPDEATPQPLHWPGEDDKIDVLRLRPWPRPQARDNAFAQNGFWSEEEAESTHAVRRTSLALLPPISISPTRASDSKRPKDTESRLVYDRITSSLVNSSLSYDVTDILNQHCVDCSTIPSDLPGTLSHLVNSENEMMKEFNIWHPNERIAMIPRHPERDGEAAKCVEELAERRTMLQVMRKRKESVLKVSKEGIRAAWAICIAERLEREMAEGQRGSKGEDDDGYDYGNFLRSMQREGSAAYTTPGKHQSDTQSADLLSVSATAIDNYSSEIRSCSLRSGITSSPPQSSGIAAVTARSSASITANKSPSNTLHRSFEYVTMPTPCLSESQRSSTPSVSSRSTPNHTIANTSPSRIPCPRLPDTTKYIGSPSKTRKYVPPSLSISTRHLSGFEEAEASPAQKEERHRAPNMDDLISWAEQLSALKRDASDSSFQSSDTVVRDKPACGVQERAEVVDQLRDERAIEFIPLPPPSAVFPSSHYPSSAVPRTIISAAQSASLSESKDRCSTAGDYFGAAVKEPAAQEDDVPRDVEDPGDRNRRVEDANRAENARLAEDSRRMEREEAEREWLAEVLRMQDREYERQARERENQSRRF